MKMNEWRKDYEERAKEWAKFRWEFMRRSPEYRADYKKAQDSLKDVKRVYNEDFQVWEVTGDIQPDLAAKYNLPGQTMIDPDISYVELLKNEKFYDTETPAFYTTLEKSVFDSSEDSGMFDQSKLIIEIDFDLVNSIRQLENYVTNLIRDFYNKQLSLDIIDDKKSYRFATLEEILTVGDAYNNKTYDSMMELAKDAIPSQFETDPDSAKTKAGRCVKKYNELVNGGYKSLAYP
jgi:hypothetical protein